MSTMPNPDPNSTLFIWNIRNFEMCTHQASEPLKSPAFSPFVPQMAKYHIMLYPQGVNKKNLDHVSVYIVKSSSGEAERDPVCSCEIGIVTARGKRHVFRIKGPPEQGQGRGLATFLDRTSLSLSDNNCDAAMSNGDLTLYCAMSVKRSDERASCKCSSTFPGLSEDIETAYYKELFCDTELKTKGKTFRVHRAMIEGRFPALAKKSENDLENIEEETVASLLRYVYTGKLNKKDMQLLDLISSLDLPYHLKSLLTLRLQDIKAETIISRKCVSFKWNVSDFSLLTSKDVLKYSIFGSDDQSWTRLNVSLTISSNVASDGDDVLFSMKRYSRECKRIICRISALNICKTFEHTFGEEDCWNISAFARRSEVVGEDSDEANFVFKISMTDGKSTSCVNSVNLSPYSAPFDDFDDDLDTFRDDLGTMLERRTHCDVDLITFSKSHDEQRYPCHRFVLATRSRVFRKMFETKGTQHSVPIGDVEPAVVATMLSYLYTGRIDYVHDLKETLDLYELANKYDILGLKKVYVRRLEISLSADTLGEVLVAADKGNDAELKEYVFDFVCKSPKLVLESTRLQQFLVSRSDLALEIMNKALACLARESNGSKEIEEPE